MILPRTGLRPLRFEGTRLAAFETSLPAHRLTIRFALYQSGQNDYAAAWSCEPEPGNDAMLSCCDAHRCGSLDAAIDVFEAASPACACGTMQQAAQNAAYEASVKAAFSHATGVFLYRLCTRDDTFGSEAAFRT